MAVEIKRIKQESHGYIAQERLWLTTDGKIVLDGDWRAAQLLASKGSVIPEKVAKRLNFGNGINVEPFEKEPRKTVAPEEIATRHTRPEKPTAER